MTCIMVVDDEADLELLIRQKFRQKIRENEYEFVFAANGIEAMSKLASNKDISVILSDINMPEMDGLTLLQKISDSYPLTQTVIVSAYGDMDNIRTAMNRGAFDFITKPVNFSDLEMTLDKTIKHVESMRNTVNAIRENNILKMYVDKNVLNFMTTKEFEKSVSENEMIEASVAFIDICGFTSISENETPDTIVNMLNQYFDLMVEEINNEGGTIDKFMGDCVMAVFRGDFHIDRAVDACIKIRDKIIAIPKENSFKPKVSIGINFGEMVYGNIGSPKMRRLDFTVIGDSVNVAQRLQTVAKPDQIVISQQGYDRIKMSFECNCLGEVMLKNKSNQVMIYEVKQ